jgi:hypothetical protein
LDSVPAATASCQDHFRFLTTGLGLRRDADLIHHNLGCAGLASGFRTAAAALVSMVPATALVVASNCPSGYFAPEVHDHYYKHPSGMGWLAPLMFADGARCRRIPLRPPGPRRSPERTPVGPLRDEPQRRAGDVSGRRLPAPHLGSEPA